MTDAGPMTTPQHVGDDLWTVVTTAVEASRLSDGSFDITVGPLTVLQREMQDRPDAQPEQLQPARDCVGWQQLLRLTPAACTGLCDPAIAWFLPMAGRIAEDIRRQRC